MGSWWVSRSALPGASFPSSCAGAFPSGQARVPGPPSPHAPSRTPTKLQPPYTPHSLTLSPAPAFPGGSLGQDFYRLQTALATAVVNRKYSGILGLDSQGSSRRLTPLLVSEPPLTLRISQEGSSPIPNGPQRRQSQGALRMTPVKLLSPAWAGEGPVCRQCLDDTVIPV